MQQRLGFLLVADEVVVDDEDVAQPEPMDLAHLRHHLLDRLGARAPAVHDDDVAELAVERAAARELDGHGAVLIDLQQIEARQRRVVHAGLLDLAVLRLPVARRVVVQELRPGVLGLIDEQDVDLVAQFLRAQRGERAAGDDELAALRGTRPPISKMRCLWIT